MANLKTNYKDYILDSSNTRRKYKMITNDDGTVSFEDVTEYSQVGDSFGGADINNTNESINELVNGITPVGMAKKFETSRKINGINFDGSADFSNYVVCNTPRTEQTKRVSIENFSLVTGASIRVKFNYSNDESVSYPILNVNGMTPRAYIIYGNKNMESTWVDGSVLDLTYDGVNWQVNNVSIATDENYGICRAINNLNEKTAIPGHVLTARQGYELSTRTPLRINTGIIQGGEVVEFDISEQKRRLLGLSSDGDWLGDEIIVVIHGAISSTGGYFPFSYMVPLYSGADDTGGVATQMLHGCSSTIIYKNELRTGADSDGNINIEFDYDSSKLKIDTTYMNPIVITSVHLL